MRGFYMTVDDGPARPIGRAINPEATIRKGREAAMSARSHVRRTHGAVYSPEEMFRIQIEERQDGVLQLRCEKKGDDLQWHSRAFFGEGFTSVESARSVADTVMYSGLWPMMNLLLAEEGTFYDDEEIAMAKAGRR